MPSAYATLPEFVKKYEAIKKVSFEYPGVPVWVTELGFPVSYTNHEGKPEEHKTFPTVSEAVRAKLTSRTFQMLQIRSGELDLRHAFFYSIADVQTASPAGWESGCGLLSESGVPRQAYGSFQQVANWYHFG